MTIITKLYLIDPTYCNILIRFVAKFYKKLKVTSNKPTYYKHETKVTSLNAK